MTCLHGDKWDVMPDVILDGSRDFTAEEVDNTFYKSVFSSQINMTW